ncbi:hypothetical protein [Hahella ganghwensis]|uniref:hypothetical protein n=1 Tax=Hahella ganghwensis TaxID=286420 RepID=UPI000367A96A|nr:hypothetical protein [Hahella ganghwensis]
MRWLRRFNATKMNPMGPDIAMAPMEAFNLSGTKLSFRCPLHEVMSDKKVAPQVLNIYQEELFEPWNQNEDKGMSVNLLYTGWKFWDKPFGEGAIGYIALDITLIRRHPHYRKIDSLLKSADMLQWLLSYSDDIWGGMNRSLWKNRENKTTPITPESHFWRYPQSTNQIMLETVNGIKRYKYVADKPNGPKERLWHIPISDDHDLEFYFRPGALNRNYYKQDHDLDSAVEKTVQEFMSHVHVRLSPEEQKRYEEVIAEEKSS